MGNNSFILTKEEKKRIKKLHEATTAGAAGAYNQPMGFTEPVEELDIETTFIDGDNIQDGSEEIEDIAQFLEVTEEDDNERMRKLHKENSIIKEQTKASSSIDSQGNETFTWDDQFADDNVIFKSATVESSCWWTIKKVGYMGYMVKNCCDCDDKTKTDLDNYKKFTTHETQQEASTSLGETLKMTIS